MGVDELVEEGAAFVLGFGDLVGYLGVFGGEGSGGVVGQGFRGGIDGKGRWVVVIGHYGGEEFFDDLEARAGEGELHGLGDFGFGAYEEAFVDVLPAGKFGEFASPEEGEEGIVVVAHGEEERLGEHAAAHVLPC